MYGYIDAINLTVLAIIMIYSIHIPFVLIFGIIYFITRLYMDVFLFCCIFKKDMESGGKLMQSNLNKVGYIILFY